MLKKRLPCVFAVTCRLSVLQAELHQRESCLLLTSGSDLVLPSMPSDLIASGQALFTPGVNTRLDMHHKLTSCDKISLPPSTCKHAHTRLQRFSTQRDIDIDIDISSCKMFAELTCKPR